MRIRYPKAIMVAGDYMSVPGFNPRPTVVLDNAQYTFVDGRKSSYFRERRRRTFSDVCHAKRPSAEHSFDRNNIADFIYSSGSLRRLITTSWSQSHVASSYTHIGKYTDEMFGDGREACHTHGECKKSWQRITSPKVRCDLEFSVIVRREIFQPNPNHCEIRFVRCQATVSATWSLRSHSITGSTASMDPSYAESLCGDILNSLVEYAKYEAASYDGTGDIAWRQTPPNSNIGSYAASFGPEVARRLLSADIPRSKWTTRTAEFVTNVEEIAPLDSTVFLLHEPDVIFDNCPDILFGRGYQAYWRNYLIQNAYLDMAEHIPRLNDNSISNLLEIIGFIKSIVIDHKIEIPKSLGDAWLSYRYAYTTTKLDVNEAIQFVHRNMDLGDWSQLHNYGQASHDYEGTVITCRCTADVYPKVLDTVGRVWRALYTYGLQPNFYVVWDMIPYSFIADWFIPIGDILDLWDTKRMLDYSYDIQNVQYSLSYDRETDDGVVHCYTRWLANTPPELKDRYLFERNTSTKTIGKRILDVASLIVG